MLFPKSSGWNKLSHGVYSHISFFLSFRWHGAVTSWQQQQIAGCEHGCTFCGFLWRVEERKTVLEKMFILTPIPSSSTGNSAEQDPQLQVEGRGRYANEKP